MKTFIMPGTDILAPNIVLGLMRIADKTDEEVREALGRSTPIWHRERGDCGEAIRPQHRSGP